MHTILLSKRSLLGYLFFFSANALMAQNTSPDEILGKWDTRKGIVEITEVNERFIGNPVSNGFKDTDVEILNLTYDENIWKGMIYSLEKDRYFYVECEMEDDQMLLLNISVSFVTKELRWVRIPGSVAKK